ncbi:MAG: signal peptidase II [Clostridia bacterium]|nr:signal peptidase II [Clostridia bacterium]
MTENVEKNEQTTQNTPWKQKVLGVLKSSWFWGVALFVGLILVDQLTKVWADWYFNRPGAPERIEVIPGWINLCITYNRGISYGMGSDAPPWLKLCVILLTGVMMAAFGVFFFKIDRRRTLLRIAIVFVVAGGVGNLIDRLYYQVWDPSTNALIRDGVRDMVDLSRLGFAVCNFADFFITGGAVMLVLALLFFDKDAMFPMTEKYKALAKEAEKNAKTAENTEDSEHAEVAEDAETADENEGEADNG